MNERQKELIRYRLERARETLTDARILAREKRWNSSVNRLYYAAYYAVTALLLSRGLTPVTHAGVKASFFEHFVKNGIVPEELGKIFSQLFTWRHKGDYDDLFDFEEEHVVPYFEPVEQLIHTAEGLVE